jgi:V8-like Glu-specific endopeptidase
MSSNVTEWWYPYDAVCQITVTLPNGQQSHGAGVLIAPDEVLTAAHLVWQQGVGAATSVTVLRGLNPPAPGSPTTVTDFHYFAINDSNGISPVAAQADFALLHVSPLLNFPAMFLRPNFAGGEVNITGYPDSAGGNYMFNQVETATTDPSTATLTNQSDPGSGSGGSPVWYVTPNQGACQVVGVVSSATTSAALTGTMVDIINSWIATDRGGPGRAPTGAVAVAVPLVLHSITTEAAPAGVSPAEAAMFDTFSYKNANQDVAASGMDPLLHFVTYGWHENRAPDPLFDVNWYLQHNPDVAASGIDPLLHYALYGWHEGRDPSASFSTKTYLAANPDVQKAGVDPLQHYLTWGVNEFRTGTPVG